MTFLQRCAVWSLPRIGVPARSLTYSPNLEALEKYTRLDLAASYREAALGSFEWQDRNTYGAGWSESDWAHVIAEHKLRGGWVSDEEDDYLVTRPAVSPNRVLGLFGAVRIGNTLRARFGAWVMGRRA